MAMSFIRVSWWFSNTATILSTLASALSKLAFRAMASFFFFWKKPKMPLFSSSPKVFNSTTREDRA